ncbi:TIGR02206 family membrane protein [Candidatus Chloroploca sp. M-50]|uniref:TIGR02206 family membrane protein n=1 Tax=Candidatus Chloroploca mongolica TaxID=2528176 RepID=A0ABS4DBT9_9CHLR|nr:TIGR02206 family membrane protein [Candidatus Chloroploca mongolica]MBP1466907.1 TIGR02206 family membrane protein [Candidatus Chloroploca mongolica]
MFPNIFGPSFVGPRFELWSLAHLLPLLAIALGCVALAWVTPRLDTQGCTLLKRGLIVYSLANWFAWDLWQLSNGLWNIQYSLPLHLCTLAVPLSALMLATSNERLFELIYFWGFAGSVQALLTPDLQSNGFNFPHFVYWIFWTSHAVPLLAALFAIRAWNYRPTWRSLGRVFLLTNAILLVVGLVNWLTGGNYMFIARKPAFPSLLDLMGPWPWYLIPLQFVGLLAFVLVYLPYALRDWLRKS